MIIPLKAVLGIILGSVAVPPLRRSAEQTLNYLKPNALLDILSAVELQKRGGAGKFDYVKELQKQGIDGNRATWLMKISERLLDISDLMSLRRRGVVDNKEFFTKAVQLGIDPTNVEKLYSLGEQRLGLGEIRAAWLRGFTPKGRDTDLWQDLRDQGWTDDRIGVMKELSHFLPPPQDVILWAAREVFEPELRKKFRLDEGIPDDYLVWAEKVGITGEVAKNYWAAHWILPSMLHVYEMWHRDVIDEKTVDSFFVQQDMNPFWREKLKAISFRPYTRVDVRRMHKHGILTDEDLVRSYQDLGYALDKAEKMAGFTIAYNLEPEEAEKTETEKRQEELKGLTRATIVKQYKERLIEQDTARAYLTDLGFSEEVVNFYIVFADYAREEEQVDSFVKVLHRMYINGIIEFNELIDRLGKLNLPAANVEYLISLWDLERQEKPSQPSKSELIKFAKKKVIDKETWWSKMKDLGYADKFIEWYNKAEKLFT